MSSYQDGLVAKDTTLVAQHLDNILLGWLWHQRQARLHCVVH